MIGVNCIKKEGMEKACREILIEVSKLCNVSIEEIKGKNKKHTMIRAVFIRECGKKKIPDKYIAQSLERHRLSIVANRKSYSGRVVAKHKRSIILCNKIVETVSKVSGLTREQIVSRSRKEDVVSAKALIIDKCVKGGVDDGVISNAIKREKSTIRHYKMGFKPTLSLRKYKRKYEQLTN